MGFSVGFPFLDDNCFLVFYDFSLIALINNRGKTQIGLVYIVYSFKNDILYSATDIHVRARVCVCV